MKRFSRIVAIFAVILVMAGSFAFAEGVEGGLTLNDTYPKEVTILVSFMLFINAYI